MFFTKFGDLLKNGHKKRKRSDRDSVQSKNMPYINSAIFSRGLNGYLNYCRFSVTGSGGSKCMKIDAVNESAAREHAASCGMAEPLSLEMLEMSRPTEQQLEYAHDLGITVPEEACHEDVSCMINRVNEDDENSPSIALAIYADHKGMRFSAWIGEKAFFNMLFLKLELRDKLAFFAYAVYCYLNSRGIGNLDTDDKSDFFYRFADRYSADSTVVTSMLKYNGSALIEFGTYSGRTRTSAYGAAARYIVEISS